MLREPGHMVFKDGHFSDYAFFFYLGVRLFHSQKDEGGITVCRDKQICVAGEISTIGGVGKQFYLSFSPRG